MMWKTYNDVWRRVWQFWVPVYLYFWVMFCTIWYLVLILVPLILVQKHIMMWRRGDSQAWQFWFPDCLYFSVIFCTIWYSGCFQTQGFDAAFSSLGPDFYFVGAFQLKSAVQRIWMPFKHIHLIPTLCFCAHFDFSMHFNWAVHGIQRIWMLFKLTMVWSQGNSRQTDSHGNVKLLLWATRLFTVYSQCAVYSQFPVYSQFIHNARYSRFPPQIWLFANNIPMLDTSQFKMQFHLSHTQAKSRWFWSPENSLVHRYYLLDRLKCWLSLLDAVGCFRFNTGFWQCVSFALTFPGTQLCALSFVKSNIEHRNSGRDTVKL